MTGRGDDSLAATIRRLVRKHGLPEPLARFYAEQGVRHGQG